MADLGTVQNKIQGLIDLSNTKTGNNDTTLTAAVNSLAEGYGKGENKLMQYLSKTIIKLTDEDFKDYNTTLPEGFFRDQLQLKEVNIPDSYEHLLSDAIFEYCEELKKVVLPDYSNIPRRAFWGCDLSEFSTKSTGYFGYVDLSAVNYESFMQTNISMNALVMHNNNLIGERGFAYTPGPRVIAFPRPMESGGICIIADGAFSNCTNVETLIIGGDPGDEDFLYDSGNYPDIFSIDYGAFMNSSLKKIVFMGPTYVCLQVLSCHSTAFEGTSITEIICSDGRVPISEVTYE